MKSNVIRLYKHYCEMAENPKGADGQERENVKRNALKAKADLEERFKTARKYQGDKDIQELISVKDKEEKKDAKKSKG